MAPSPDEIEDMIDNPKTQFKPGDKLGSIELIEIIGEGATSFVWRAHDKGLNRPRAAKELKLIFAMLASTPVRRRAIEEAQLMADLRHPNIVMVHQVFEEKNRCVVIMDLVEGSSLDRLIQRDGKLTLERARRIILCIIDALIYAYDKRKVIHRDIKPANILLEGTKEEVRVTDFGLAVSEISDRRTRVGYELGTREYAAPEQLLDASSVDLRADHHALGVMLHEMLTGDLVDLRQPGAWEAFQPDTDPDIAALIKKMTHPNREERHSTHEELRDALETTLRRKPLPRSTPTIVPEAEREPKPKLRRLSTIGIGALVIMTTLAVLGWAFYPNASPPIIAPPVIVAQADAPAVEVDAQETLLETGSLTDSAAPVQTDTSPDFSEIELPVAPIVIAAPMVTPPPVVTAAPLIVKKSDPKQKKEIKPEPTEPTLVNTATGNVVSVEARRFTPKSVTVYYRLKGSTDAYEPKTCKLKNGRWEATIPHGSEYFLDAKTLDGQRVRSGSPAAPGHAVDP